MSKAEAVKVAVRCRPLNSKEREKGNTEVVTVDNQTSSIQVRDPREPESAKPKSFTFDFAYGQTSTQKQVYDQCASGIVSSVLEGYNGTIFAYGQTGTGKTHTMDGDRKSNVHKGIMPRAFEHIFTVIKGTEGKQFLVRCSMLELYNEEIRDLLAKSDEKLKIRRTQDGVVLVEGLSNHEVKDADECLKLLDKGASSKAVASTDMNERSSRSHCIFSVIVECSEPRDDGDPHITKGKLNLVDLAGSERQKKTNATGKQFKEACSINLSLVTLGNVIQALVEKNSSHVPYRDSKLTILLEDSLGGNAKTMMVAAIGPADYNYDETKNTLMYADRAKRIKNAPKINENPKDAKIREMQEEIEKLKMKLAEGLKNIKGFNLEELMAKGGTGHDEQLKLIEAKVREEEEELERMAELERKQIADMQNIDKKKRDELLNNLKNKQDVIEKERKEKEALLKDLKEKEERVLVGSKQNEQDMLRYNQELEQMKREMEEKSRRQEEMQKEIANAQLIAAELNDKMASNKGNIRVKQQNLERMKRAIEQQRSVLERMRDDHESGTREIREEIKDKQKMIKLYQLVMNFVPKEYRDFVHKTAEAEKGGKSSLQVPNRLFTGNKLMEEALHGKAKLLNAWREGNDPVISYHSDDLVEEAFYRRFRDHETILDEGDVPIIGKEVPNSAAKVTDD
jgi:kinesin family protein 3/17